MTREPMIDEPRRINPLLRLGIRFSDRVTGRRMVPARLLAWYPRAAVGAGVLESLIAHDEPSPRLLKLIRITASLATSCPFCVDMNSHEWRAAGVTDDELAGLQRWLGGLDDAPPATLDPSESVAVRYTRALSATPVEIPDALRDELTAAFSEREVVIVVTTAAQVNFWARTIAGLGIPAAGFCQLPSAGEHRRTPPVSDHD